MLLLLLLRYMLLIAAFLSLCHAIHAMMPAFATLLIFAITPYAIAIDYAAIIFTPIFFFRLLFFVAFVATRFTPCHAAFSL